MPHHSQHSECPLWGGEKAVPLRASRAQGWGVEVGCIQLCSARRPALGHDPICTTKSGTLSHMHIFSRQHMTQTPSPPSLSTFLEMKITCWVCLSFYVAYCLQDLGQLLNYRRPQFPHLHNKDNNSDVRDYHSRETDALGRYLKS